MATDHMDDLSRRSSEENNNPFSFSSFLKHQKPDDDLSVIEEINGSEIEETSQEDLHPFSIKGFLPLHESKYEGRKSLVILEENDPPELQLPLPLPDPSDLGILPEPGLQIVTPDSKSPLVDEHLEQLNEEKEELEEKLRKAEELLLDKDFRIETLALELDRVSRREREETATLELMMQSVENNLQITTTRAVAAENQVLKLKMEIKTLQSQVLNLEQELRASVNEGEVSSRAGSVATKMNQAAKQAEASLKDLLEGVNQLRLLSSVVADLTKVSDVS